MHLRVAARFVAAALALAVACSAVNVLVWAMLLSAYQPHKSGRDKVVVYLIRPQLPSAPS